MNQTERPEVLIVMKKISFTFFGLALAALIWLMAMDVEEVSMPEIFIGMRAETKSPAADPFEKAVALIKKYETLHQPRHWPLVGYGHKVLPGEKFSRRKALSEKEADALLRKDLLKNCAMFRSYGPDSLLLGVLAYNIGSGAAGRSKVAAALKAGNRNIEQLYYSHCRYRGKVHKQILQRRKEEFAALFVVDSKKSSLEENQNEAEMDQNGIPKNDSVAALKRRNHNKTLNPSVSYLCKSR